MDKGKESRDEAIRERTAAAFIPDRPELYPRGRPGCPGRAGKLNLSAARRVDLKRLSKKIQQERWRQQACPPHTGS
jgi:hypothetical protein